MKKLFAGALTAMALVACGGPGSMDGTVAGQSLDVVDGVLLEERWGSTRINNIVLGNKSGICDDIKANQRTKDSTWLFIQLTEATESGEIEPTVGDYNIVSGNGTPLGKLALAGFGKIKTDSCEFDPAIASSGKITVTSYDAAKGAKGTYELNFASGDKVSGEFDVPACDATATEEEATCK